MSAIPPDMPDPSDGLPASPAGPWALEKHRELARYIDATWAARAKWKTSAYIDLFSGPGRQHVEETGEFFDGSPLVAWKASLRGRAPFHKAVIADARRDYVTACAKRLAAQACPTVDAVGAANESARWAASQVDRDGLQLAFLDPFNFRHLPWEVFQALIEIPHVDFIVHFSQQDLSRNLDRYFADDQSVLEAFAPGWRQAVDQRDKVQMRGRFIEYWISLFERHGFNAAQRVPLITTDNNVPLYRLVFLSRHPFPRGLWDSLDTKRQRPLFG